MIRPRHDAQTGGVGLTLWQLLGELQVLLACWAGPVRCASVPHHGGYLERDDHQPRPDRALL